MRLLFLALLSLLSFSALAQSSVRGKVLDEATAAAGSTTGAALTMNRSGASPNTQNG